MLQIKDLYVKVEGRPILKGVNLQIADGEIHALMGPNGMGKSTLAKVLVGHPSVEVTSGEITFDGKNLFTCSAEERAHMGLFLAFQYPVELPGVSSFQFLNASLNQLRKKRGEEALSEEQFSILLEEKLVQVALREEFKNRFVNVGFSGGEKKKSEILQMALFEPKFSILDEIDSGLDMDASLRIIDSLRKIKKESDSLLFITHSLRFLELMKPDRLHILLDGKIVKSGERDLVSQLERSGFSHFCQKECKSCLKNQKLKVR